MNTTNILSQFSDELAALAAQAAASVVLVDARRRFPASGVAYAADLVLTADHVIEREEDISVTLEGGRTISAAIAGRDPGRDLALLRLGEPASAPFTPADAAKVGQMALALARPDRSGVQVSLGAVSAVGGPARTHRGALLEQYYQAEIFPYPGFSGGALVDMQGRLLGLNTSGLSMGTLVTIPAGLAWQAAASLSAHGRIRRAYLGVRSQEVTLSAAQKSALGREQESALLLVGVEADAPAAGAGLQAGDLLAGLDGRAISDPEALQAVLAGASAGQEAQLEILRGERKLMVKVKLAER